MQCPCMRAYFDLAKNVRQLARVQKCIQILRGIIWDTKGLNIHTYIALIGLGQASSESVKVPLGNGT